jgi:endonuclease/exonuclease/phosphatase family metal-dependent hydrolase
VTGAPAEPARLRVVTWNIRAAIGPGEPFPPAWWRHVRRDRLERIAGILAELEPDVVTLQEVAILTPDGALDDQPAELGRLLAMAVRYASTHSFRLVDPADPSIAQRGQRPGSATPLARGSAMWGNAVLSRDALADGFAVGLPRAEDDDLVEPADADHDLAGVRYEDTEPGHRERRCVVGGVTAGIGLATTHLSYMGREQRRRQADALRAAIERFSGPLVVSGDFNAPLHSPELASLRDGLADAFTAVGIGPADPARNTSNGWPIDHVLVRGLTVDSCRVATEAGDASDHWPVVVDLRRA